MTLALAVVGCGAIAGWHLDAIARAGAPVHVSAVVDPDTERARRISSRTGAPAFASLGEALGAVPFDAALVAVPHHLHEPVVLEAFAARKHVLLEKPLAPTLDLCDQVLAAAPADRVFMVAENAQYWPEVQTVRAELERGAIGEVITASASALFPPLPEFYGGDAPWRFDLAAAGGGIAIDTGSHWLRPLRIWLGEVCEVAGIIAHPYPRMQGESLCRALLRFESGVTASFDALLTDGAVAPRPLFTVTGTRGELTVEGSGWVKRFDGTDAKGTKIGPQGGYLASYEGEWLDFCAAVLEGTTPAAPAADALGELRCALALYRSAASGRWEPVWD